MLRLFSILAAIVLFALPALAQEPGQPVVSLKMQTVVVEGASLFTEQPIQVVRNVPRTQERIVNGMKTTVTVIVPVLEIVLTRVTTRLQDVSVHDLAGAKIDPDRVPELLKKPTAVIISPTGEIDKAFRAILKDNTLIVVLPPPPILPPASPR